jgi:hypothetical protein
MDEDMDWDGTYIVDDDLNAAFSKLPAGVHLEVLLDSCHSGTGTREAAALACLPREHAIKKRFLIPPVDILCRQVDEDDLKLQKIGRADNPRPMFFSPAAKTTRHLLMPTSAALTTAPSLIISAKPSGMMFRAPSLAPSFSNVCAPP